RQPSRHRASATGYAYSRTRVALITGATASRDGHSRRVVRTYRERAAAAAVADVCAAGADRGEAGGGAGQTTASFHLAACHSYGGSCRRSRAHRDGVVENAGGKADAGLLSRRG